MRRNSPWWANFTTPYTPACAEFMKPPGKKQNQTNKNSSTVSRRYICLPYIQRKTTLWAILLIAARFKLQHWGGGNACGLNRGTAGLAAATVNLLEVQQLVSQQQNRRRCRCDSDLHRRGAKTGLFPPDLHCTPRYLLPPLLSHTKFQPTMHLVMIQKRSLPFYLKIKTQSSYLREIDR